MRVISFSADGLKQAAKRGLYDWIAEQDADFICVQDIRCSEYDLRSEKYFPPEYNAYFFDDVDGKKNGVALYCRKLPKAIMTGLGFADFDMQGRYIQADYERLSVGCLLAPSADDDDDGALERKSEFFELLGNHLQKVRNKRREFIICGNWQIAHTAADLQCADDNAGKPGFLGEERQWMDELLTMATSTRFGKSTAIKTNLPGGRMTPAARPAAGAPTCRSYHRVLSTRSSTVQFTRYRHSPAMRR